MHFFTRCVADNLVLIAKAMKNQFVIPEWVTFAEHIDDIYELCKECKKGTVGTSGKNIIFTVQ